MYFKTSNRLNLPPLIHTIRQLSAITRHSRIDTEICRICDHANKMALQKFRHKDVKNTVCRSCNKMPIHYPLLTLESTHVCLFNLSRIYCR